MYKVFVKKSAEKQLSRISKEDFKRIDKAIIDLSQNPFPKSGIKLKGKFNVYRIRQGNYRVLYTVDIRNKEVTIFRLKHRRDVYQ